MVQTVYNNTYAQIVGSWLGQIAILVCANAARVTESALKAGNVRHSLALAEMQHWTMKHLIIIGILFCSVDSFGQLINGERLKKQTYYDSTLNGMRLRDVQSVEKVIGTKDNMIDSQDERTEVININGDQLLTMTFHPGDIVNQFSQFKIEYNSKKVKSIYKIGDKEFVSGKGIRLGINEQKLVAALGQPKEKKADNGFVVYHYKQEDGLYFGHYWFKNGRLERFWFGEEYP